MYRLDWQNPTNLQGLTISMKQNHVIERKWCSLKTVTNFIAVLDLQCVILTLLRYYWYMYSIQTSSILRKISLTLKYDLPTWLGRKVFHQA